MPDTLLLLWTQYSFFRLTPLSNRNVYALLLQGNQRNWHFNTVCRKVPATTLIENGPSHKMRSRQNFSLKPPTVRELSGCKKLWQKSYLSDRWVGGEKGVQSACLPHWSLLNNI